MKDVIFDEYQNCVNESLIRHRSLLDILSKLQESESKLNRSIIKAVTNCGCININASRQELYSADDDCLDDLRDLSSSHVSGELCEQCRDTIERELGNHFFYLTSLCNTVNVNLYDTLLKEYDKSTLLGKYHLR